MMTPSETEKFVTGFRAALVRRDGETTLALVDRMRRLENSVGDYIAREPQGSDSRNALRALLVEIVDFRRFGGKVAK